MGLESRFFRNGSVYGAGQGGNAANLQAERDAIIGSKEQSKLHAYLEGSTTIPGYSLDGTPLLNRPNLPRPSSLDLDGLTPATYRDRAPEGASF
jgi:hypothetical protein